MMFEAESWRVGTLACAALVVGAVACNSGNTVEIHPMFAAVYGFVSGPTGIPVANARISASAYAGSCGQDLIASADATTDVSGHYRIRLTSLDGRNATCITVLAIVLDGIADTVRSNGSELAFAPDRAVGTEDSLRVDVHAP